MTLFYLDTSALAKLYIAETGTDLVRGLLVSQERHEFFVLSFSRIELRSAIRRRVRMGDIDSRLAESAFTRFGRHMATRFEKLEISDYVVDLAVSIANRHPLTGSDSLQLGGCMFLQEEAPPSPVFLCADRQLLQAARAEGLSCLNPTE